jgi:hypothetical protein
MVVTEQCTDAEQLSRLQSTVQIALTMLAGLTKVDDDGMEEKTCK